MPGARKNVRRPRDAAAKGWSVTEAGPRATAAKNWSVTEVEVEAEVVSEADVGRYVRAAPQLPNADGERYDHYADNPAASAEHQNDLAARVLELENVIKELSGVRSAPPEGSLVNTVSTPTIPYIEPAAAPRTTPLSSSAGGSIRWDSIKPFPRNVAATKMWEAWTRFHEDFEIAISLSNLRDPKQRVELLLLAMGDELKSIVRAAKLRPTIEDEYYYSEFVDNIDQHLKAMTDPAAEHEDFSKMYQEEGESAVKFHARLTEKVLLCNYSPADQDTFVRTQLLRGLRNPKLRQEARMYNHNCNTIVQAATRAEAFEAELMVSRQVPREESNALAIDAGKFRGTEGQHKRESAFHQPSRNLVKRFKSDRRSDYQSRSSAPRRERCSRCFMYSHGFSGCPALKKNCFSCGRPGHFEIACRAKEIRVVKGENSGIPKDENREQHINALSLQDVQVDCRIGSSSPIQFLIDSGADVNVIGGADWDKLEKQFGTGKASLVQNRNCLNNNLRSYASNKPMQIECSFRATIEVIGFTRPIVTAEFIVVKEGKRSLLGRNTASDMGLLKVGEMVNTCEKSSIFPKMPGVKIKFSVDNTVPPVRNAYYNIPAAYREGARRRLEQMEARGIIERVTTAPLWISGMSAVPKGKNDFRLVVNMRAPNKAIKREYFRLPLIDEMKVKLHGAKFFTKLDLSDAFYHLELSEESRELTTFLSETGMYRFTRLMFGVNCAPEVFQREMMRILKDVDNKIVYIDDVLLYAETVEELRKIVAQVLQILRSNNLTLNTSKCEYDQTRINFLGHELSDKGFNIEETKVKDIQKFRSPSTSSELRSFLGLASFVSPYIKDFAKISAPLWEVTTAQKWSWGKEQENAFELIKKRIVDSTISLGFFAESDETILYTDASPKGLGVVLVQRNREGTSRIISFASKSLTKTEKDYGQNQREALGAVWAVEHFAYFLLGRRFILRTDAQGMTFILNRCREESKRAQTRADGWALRLSPYNYDVEYIRGRDNIADPSSRLYCGEDEAFNEEISPWEICHLEPGSNEFLTEDEIRQYTKRDDTLMQVVQAMETQTWPRCLLKFKSVANDLHFADGILVKSGCAVIPLELRNKTLEIAHAGHPLEAKLKSILRRRVWWPGMGSDAEKWVKACAICSVNGRPERPPPMLRKFAPKGAWEIIALDFNGPYQKLGGISILVIIDLRSRYAIARPVKSTKFEYTRAVLDEAFDWEGFPKAMKSDNGPPFNGEDYAKYCSDRGIQTIFSTPFCPQQNGLVEGFMKVVNKAMAAAISSGACYQKELQAAVQSYNAADHSITKLSPEEVLAGRKIKRGLPLLDYKKSEHDEQALDARDREAKLRSKEREDIRRAAKESKVKPGDTVIVERPSRGKGDSKFGMKRFTVMQEQNGNLVLCDSEGQQLKRHVSQTKKVQQWRETAPPGVPKDASGSKRLASDIPEDASGSKRPASDIPNERPKREKRPPSYLSGYARTVADG